jgi:hypothetical protein
VWGQQVLADRFDFCDDAFVLFQDVQELVVVHLELLFLEQNNPG